MKMATSDLKLHQVEPLATISFFSIIKQAWKRSGCQEKLSEYCYPHAQARAGVYSSPPTTLDPYFDVLDRTLRNILDLDCLTHSLKIKLGNCMLDFDKKVVKFAMFLASALAKLTKENVDACIDSIVLSPAGHIDKQKTLFKLIFDRKIEGNLNIRFSSYHCVSLKEAVKELKRRQEAGEQGLESLELEMSFGEPGMFWGPKHHYEGMGGQFFQCVALHGDIESMDFYLTRLGAAETAAELCKAACHIVIHRYNAEKILFFYKHMEPAHWQELLRRYFYLIFTEMFCSKRYRYMCVVFYNQAVNNMELSLIKNILDYLCEQCSLEVGHTCTSRSVYTTLLVEDLVPMFQSIWRITPLQHRKSIGHQIYKILNKFLFRNKFYLVSAIINDSAFDDEQKNTLTSCVVMKLIVNNKKDQVSSFLRILEDEKPSTKELLLTLDHLKVFIPMTDNCQSIMNYNMLIQQKFPMEDGIKAVKELLIEDKTFMLRVIEAIKLGCLGVEDVEKLLKWIFADNTLLTYIFIQKNMLPHNLMAEIYKNYIISTRKSFDTIDCFYLTDLQVQTIRRSIANDLPTLYQYCFDLLRVKDFTALPNLLTCVFKHEQERELFLRTFFRSDKGIQAVYSMLIEESFDERFFCRHQFKNKLDLFLKFKIYWIISSDIASDLDFILEEYGHPNTAAMNLDFKGGLLKFFPHESVDSFKVICDTNYTIFRCLLRNSCVVELMNLVVQ